MERVAARANAADVRIDRCVHSGKLRAEQTAEVLVGAVVGHLPFLDRLASLLITDDENIHVVEFRMGGLVKLVPKSEGPGFTVAWILAPEIA